MKTKVLFLINDLGGGGAERVLVNLVNNMDANRFDITVQTIFKAGVNKELLKSHIRLVDGNRYCFKGVSRVIKILPKSFFNFFLRPIYKENYDVVIAYLQGAPTKLLWNYNGKKIAWLHSDLRFSPLKNFFFKNQISKCFATYDRIIGVSNTVCESFVELYGLDNKVNTLYNTNDIEEIVKKSNMSCGKEFSWNSFDGIKIITLGRLMEAKGYDRLLNVCKRLIDCGFDFRLLILGKGELEVLLRKIIKDNDLEKYVELGGFISNPYPYLKSADLFVCSSRYEGMSTVVCESLILGVPVISTEVSGAREILGDSEYGFIVDNNEDRLYEGLKELLSNHEKLDYYNRKALERASVFNTESTVSTVENLIEDIVGK